jgi:hypothetical protein
MHLGPPPSHLFPIKGRPVHDEDPHPSNSPPPGPHRARTVAIPSRSSTNVAPSPRHRTSSGEGQNRTPMSSSLFSPPPDEPSWPVSAGSRSSGEPPPPPLFCVHRGPAPPVVHESWTESMAIFHWKINRKPEIPTNFAVSPQPLCEIKLRSINSQEDPLIFENNFRYSPSHLQKL